MKAVVEGYDRIADLLLKYGAKTSTPDVSSDVTKDDEYDAEDESEQSEVVPECWWPYQWFRCDCCGNEWQIQYYEGKSRRPRCPKCGDDLWVGKVLKGF